MKHSIYGALLFTGLLIASGSSNAKQVCNASIFPKDGIYFLKKGSTLENVTRNDLKALRIPIGEKTNGRIRKNTIGEIVNHIEFVRHGSSKYKYRGLKKYPTIPKASSILYSRTDGTD